MCIDNRRGGQGGQAINSRILGKYLGKESAFPECGQDKKGSELANPGL